MRLNNLKILSRSVLSHLLLVFFIAFMTACRENYTPKPKGYFKVDFPEKKYSVYQSECPFIYEYPVYARIEKDTDQGAQPCWMNVHYLPFDAWLHLSYKSFSSKEKLYEMEEDAHELAYKHTVKANAINEDLINTGNDVFGIFYNLEGNTATVMQFYVTDKKQHYLRGALYFSVKTNRDSLDPMIDFLRTDVKHMINTLKWK